MEIEKVERGGRPLQATGTHERIMELLTSVGTPRVHGSVTPRKIMERVKLGEAISKGEQSRLGIKAAEVLEDFFRDIVPPRLESSTVLHKGIVRGVADGVFAYTSLPAPSQRSAAQAGLLPPSVISRSLTRVLGPGDLGAQQETGIVKRS